MTDDVTEIMSISVVNEAARAVETARRVAYAAAQEFLKQWATRARTVPGSANMTSREVAILQHAFGHISPDDLVQKINVNYTILQGYEMCVIDGSIRGSYAIELRMKKS